MPILFAFCAGGGRRRLCARAVKKQSAFARRFAREMQKRWQLRFAKQSDFAEPLVRVNTDVINAAALGWSAKPSVGCHRRLLQKR